MIVASTINPGARIFTYLNIQMLLLKSCNISCIEVTIRAEHDEGITGNLISNKVYKALFYNIYNKYIENM